MTRKRSGSYVWVTWLSRLMAGEVQCAWAPWFRSHYTGYARSPSDFQLAQWQAEHTQLLLELESERELAGESVYKESQNRFQVRWPNRLVVGGTPDLIAVNHDGEAVVYDVKTGQPRHSDLLQVMLYMLCLAAGSPMYKGKALRGCIVYKNGDRTHIPPEATDAAFRKNARYFLDLLDAETPPKRRPTVHECRYCDITAADCPERVMGGSDDPEEEIPTVDW